MQFLHSSSVEVRESGLRSIRDSRVSAYNSETSGAVLGKPPPGKLDQRFRNCRQWDPSVPVPQSRLRAADV
jgi:hypothetical protein